MFKWYCFLADNSGQKKSNIHPMLKITVLILSKIFVLLKRSALFMPFHFTLKAQSYTRFKPTISEVACNSIISWYVKLCEFLRRQSIRVLSKSLKLWFTLLRYNQNDCILWSWILDLCSLFFKLLISEFTRVVLIGLSNHM